MVMRFPDSFGKKTRRGMLTTDLVVAMGILAIALIPLSGSFVNDQKLIRAYYFRAVAMEIVDGEIESLAAGEWKSFPEGASVLTPRGLAAKNLPAGTFLFTRNDRLLRLEWQPKKADGGGRVSRDVKLP